MSRKAQTPFALILAVGLIAIAGLYFLGPVITSFVIKEFSYSENLNLIVTTSSEYIWGIKNPGELKNLRIDGYITNFGDVRAYLEHNGERFLILDSSKINASKEIAVAAQSQIGQEEELENATGNIERSIMLKLRYNENTEYDKNNDGKESIYGVVDLVSEALFNWDVNEENLCTRWEMLNQEDLTSTQVCYGSSNCCAFINLVPKRANWSEPYFANFGNDNLGHKNIISAQVIYTEFNSSGDSLYSNTVASKWRDLNASFYDYYKEFFNLCEETCELKGLNKSSYKMIFEISNATLTISRIYYDVDVDIANKHPELIQDIPQITMAALSGSKTINLSNFFNDPDGDKLEYDYYKSDGIEVIFYGDMAEIKPKIPGAFQTFIIANDSEKAVASNLFLINITSNITSDITHFIKKFIIKSNGDDIASIDEFGNAYFANILENQSEIAPTQNSFIIQNASGLNLSYVNSSGALFLRGFVEEFSTLETFNLGFEIKNGRNEPIAFFDNSGNLKLKGKVYGNYSKQ